MNSLDSEVCTTQEAAKLLGISVTSVKQLVESGEIPAWKTKGGHRRISLAAVHAYKAAPAAGEFRQAVATAATQDNLRLLVVEDDEMQRSIYEKKIASWKLPLDVRFCANGYQALVEIASQKPDVLFADIFMEGIDGYEVIRTVLAYPHLESLHIAIISGLSMEEIEKRGGVPKGVAMFSKPVIYEELCGYLKACCAFRQKSLPR